LAPARALLNKATAASERMAGNLDALESRVLMAASDVVINEIMYNSATAETADEYIELYNKGGTPVTLTGWKLASGIDYTFGSQTIGAGQYLVVAANLSRFATKYPAVSNVVGNWTGTLSNSSNTIKLLDPLGQEMDRVAYADDGDWAVRRRGGLPPVPVTSATSIGTTATFNVTAHGLAVGNKVAIFGANQPRPPCTATSFRELVLATGVTRKLGAEQPLSAATQRMGIRIRMGEPLTETRKT